MILQKTHVTVLEWEQAGQVLRLLLQVSIGCLGTGSS